MVAQREWRRRRRAPLDLRRRRASDTLIVSLRYYFLFRVRFYSEVA